MTVRGVDAAEREFFHFDVTNGRFLQANGKELLVPLQLADKLGVKLNDAIQVESSSGVSSTQIVGLLANRGAGAINDGGVVYTSLEHGQAMVGRGNVVTTLSVRLNPDVSIADWIRARSEPWAEGLDFIDAQIIRSSLEPAVGILSDAFGGVAAISLFVSAFLVYLMISMNLLERMQVNGVMLAVGATRPQLLATVLWEAGTLGVASTLLALGLGLGVAKLLLWLVAFQLETRLSGLSVSPMALGFSVLLGVGITLAAAIPPTLAVMKVGPSQAIRAGRHLHEVAKSGKSWVLGCVALPLGSLLGIRSRGLGGLLWASILLVLLGSVLIIPALLVVANKISRPLTRSMKSLLPIFATAYVIRQPKRTGYALGMMTVVMAMIFANLSIQKSVERGLSRVIDSQFGADLIVVSGDLFSSSSQFSADFEKELAEQPGVQDVVSIVFSRVRIPLPEGTISTSGMLVEPEEYFSTAGFAWEEGSDHIARSHLESGASILVADTFARTLGLKVGEVLQVEVGGVEKKLTIAGIYKGFAGPRIVLPISFAPNIGGPNAFQVRVSEGLRFRDIAQGITGSLGKKHDFQIHTPSEIKERAREDFGRSTRVFLAVVLLTAVGGTLALAITTSLTVYERSREIGVLRSLGASRPQVARLILFEALGIGIGAFLLALPLGILLASLVTMALESELGISSIATYPFRWVPGILLIAVALSLLSSAVTSQRTASQEIVSALRFE